MTDEKQRVNRPKRMRLPLSQLTTEPHTFQFREFETVEDHVRSLTEAIRTGDELDPMTVWKRGDADHVVVDGHHRHAAYTAAGYAKAIPVVVHECSETDAVLLALNENTKTKLPMTKTERDNAAWRLVCSDHQLSKAQTVKATGVSNGTVAKMRRTRKALEEQEAELPDTWWMAMRALKGIEQQEWDEDMQEQVIEARAKALDDAIGKELGRMGSRQWEAVARVLERRLSKQVLAYVVDELREDDEDEEDLPF
jgi:ParB-like chromosome segregation protein Spo0J